jgi:hypothetical protein
MTPEQNVIHKRFMNFRERFRESEIEFLSLIQEAERTRLHRSLGCSSVFKYAVDILAFSESVAYTYISVARKALEFPELIDSGLSVSKASRIVSTLTKENSAELIKFALNNSSQMIDREVARINPRSGRERIKPLSDEFFEIKVRVSKDFPDLVERVQALQAQRRKAAGLGAALEAGLREYLRRYDPVQKAERAWKRREKADQAQEERLESDVSQVDKLCLNRVRKPLSAARKHEVFARDQGRCTHTDARGRRCGSDRWVDIHHIRPISQGGGNELDNLTTVCSFHHDLIHEKAWIATVGPDGEGARSPIASS